jgi:hypothetical protein
VDLGAPLFASAQLPPRDHERVPSGRGHRRLPGVTQRWWRLVTYADEWQARHLLNRRIPGGIYRGSNWLFEGRCADRLVWIHHETGVQVSCYSDGITVTYNQMRARGCVSAGRFALWRFISHLTFPAHEHTRRAHAMRHALPAIVLQLPLEAA